MKKKFFKKYKIERNAPCPCGSGKKFKKCCLKYLHLSDKLHDKALSFLNLKDYSSAEIYFRAFLTQYIIWYHEHTEPFYNDCPNEAEFILLVDIEAVTSIIFQIVRCLHLQSKNKEINIFLNRTEKIILDSRYIFNIRSYYAFWLDYFGDTENAKELLRNSNYNNYKKYAESDFGREGLLFLLYTIGLELPLVSNLEIIQEIINKTKDDKKLIEALNYKALISFLYLDNKSAEKFIDEALEKIKVIEQEEECIEEYYYVVFSRALQLKGVISLSETASRRAIKYLNDTISFMKNDPETLSSIYLSIGQIYKFIGDFEKAHEYLKKAYDLHKNLINSIDLARIDVLLGNIYESQDILEEIKYEDLDKNISIDFYAIKANLAIKKGDKTLAKKICKEMANLDIVIPKLQEIKNIIINSLYEMINEKSDPGSLIQRIFNGVNHYLILQPNLFGIGININEIIKSGINNKKNKGG
jgi:tetratricopeptide (TPR) repeat protein